MESKLYRSDVDRVFGGVCGGLAEYFKVDPLVVRIAFMLFAMLDGIGLVLYLVLWLLVPSEVSVDLKQESVVRENVSEIKQQAASLGQSARDAINQQRWGQGWSVQAPTGRRALGLGVVLVIVGLVMLLDAIGLLRWFSLGDLWPLILIAVGIVVLLNNLRGKR